MQCRPEIGKTNTEDGYMIDLNVVYIDCNMKIINPNALKCIFRNYKQLVTFVSVMPCKLITAIIGLIAEITLERFWHQLTIRAAGQ